MLTFTQASSKDDIIRHF